MRKQSIGQASESNGMVVALDALAKSIARWTEKGDQFVTAIPGLSLHRRHEPTQPASYMYEPSICVVAQGAKRVVLGDDVYVYDARHFDHVRGSPCGLADLQSEPGEALSGACLEA